MSLADLSPEEHEALASAARGESAATLAQAKAVSIHTITRNRRGVLRKLGAARMIEAVNLAAKERLAKYDAGEGPLNARQGAAIHVRCDEADRKHRRPAGETKRLMLEEVSREFGRTIEHTNELSYREASSALNFLADELRTSS